MTIENLRIVLVETTHPGNIGAAARAMKNMALKRLVLVRPARFPHAEATARAAGADDVLAAAQVVDSLDAALQGCGLVVGTSARSRGIGAPELDPRQCATKIIEYCQQTQVALMFGRESSGLNNDEMDRCHLHVRIPTNPDFSSLNLAAAVLLLVYEVRMAMESAQFAEPVPLSPRNLPASAEEMSYFYEHLREVLLETGFLNPANPRLLMRRLRQLFNRAQPSHNDVAILRGILTSIQRPKRRGN